MLSFVVPLPPSDNNLYATGDSGRRHLSETAQKAKEDIGYITNNAAALAGWNTPEGPLAIQLIVHFQPAKKAPKKGTKPKKRDIQNRMKLALDSVSESLGFDDERFHRVDVIKGEDREEGCIEVTVGAFTQMNIVLWTTNESSSRMMVPNTC